MVYLSGSRKDDRNYIGVGFIVAPWAKTAVITFHAVTERIGSLRLKVPGGTLTILSVYAPHDKHPFEDRHQFFSDVVAHTKSDTKHHATMVLGDFNAKLGCVMVGEENMIGEHVFYCPLTGGNTSLSNRSLLIELCVAKKLVIANTYFDHPDENKVTYRGITTKQNRLFLAVGLCIMS